MNHVYYIELMEILYWILGYIGGGLLFMFLAPLLMWTIDRCEVGAETFFEKSTYSTKWDYVTDFFDSDSDEDLVVIILYMIFWPIGIAFCIAILPFVFFFNLIKFLIHLPANLIEKSAQKAQDEENYRSNVEYQYRRIMEKERANDFKN